ncbi:hypothetical protein ACLVWQ_20190 [Streptomyces sp. CWNU-52B]|uniref:hypothetical protein n=1 Tax=unclassified Streptomyces TaxID=2593676 RepID=UPI0039C14F42
MEQRIGPNTQPLQGAAADPAFVPGITGPRPAEPDAAKPKDAEPEETAEKRPVSKGSASKAEAPEEEPEDKTSAPADDESAAEPTAEADAEPDDRPESETDAKPEDEPEGKPDDATEAGSESGSEDEAPDGGPVFEASDRRAKIVADHTGVRLTLDDQEAEFRWDEIGAVETESPRFGKRFTITVHTPDRRWYPLEIEATARSRFKEWETSLDEVLDTYFEDDEDGEAAEAAEASAP